MANSSFHSYESDVPMQAWTSSCTPQGCPQRDAEGRWPIIRLVCSHPSKGIHAHTQPHTSQQAEQLTSQARQLRSCTVQAVPCSNAVGSCRIGKHAGGNCGGGNICAHVQARLPAAPHGPHLQAGELTSKALSLYCPWSWAVPLPHSSHVVPYPSSAPVTSGTAATRGLARQCKDIDGLPCIISAFTAVRPFHADGDCHERHTWACATF